MRKLTAKQHAAALLAAVQEAPAAQRSDVVRSFLRLLVRRRLTKLLPRVVEHLQAMEDIANGVTRVHAWSAAAVDVNDLADQLQKAIGRVALELETDPALIGGLRLKIGDRLIDGTLRNRLNRLQTQLIES